MTPRFRCYHIHALIFFSREVILHGNRRGIHIIPKISTQIGLSKENKYRTIKIEWREYDSNKKNRKYNKIKVRSLKRKRKKK